MALVKTTFNVPLSRGLNTKADPRALEAPDLAVCKNAVFDEVGGIQKRLPYSSVGMNIFGGGTLTGVRQIAKRGDERLAFTAEAVYSWSAKDTAWVLKATYLAAKVTERPVFVDPTEQVSTDRCEVGNCIIYTWVVNHATATSRRVWVAAKDKTTGSVVLPPTQPSASSVVGVDRPRLVALASKALLFFVNSDDDLVVIGLTPGTLAADLAVAGTLILDTANHTDKYDVVSDGTSAYFAAVRNPTTSYEVGKVTSSVVVTQSTKARTADDCITVAVSPGATRLVVGRPSGTSIIGDVLNSSTLADVSVSVALGTAAAGDVQQMTACYRSVQVGGQWTCYVFWSCGEDADGAADQQVEVATLNDAGTAAGETTLLTNLALASRAWDHNGRVYFNAIFAINAVVSGAAGSPSFRSQPQNTYFTYRDDGFLVAKAATHRAAGYRSVTGHLPGVQSLGSNVYAWCGGERRAISINDNQGDYSARAPRDIQITFDTNEARRSAMLGPTLYIAGGEVMAYDGTNLVECGWHVFPYGVIVSDSGAGNVDDGAHTWGVTARWDNANGERDRSTMVSTDTETMAGGGSVAGIFLDQFEEATHKDNSCQEIWRTAASPAFEAPLYLVTSQDPTAVTGANAYVPNASAAATSDNYSDATLITKEAFDENGGVLERLAPPPASIIVSTQDRLFLAGISDNPYRVAYSRLRGESEVASFHDALVVDVPPSGGAITALAFLNETLIAFCETAIWALPGDGFDNTGQGSNYGPARILASDVGAVSHETVALTPQGLIFKSSKGWYMLNRGWGVEYIGGPVSSFDSDTCVAVHVMESKHQVRILNSSSRMLVWDYLVNQWSEWTVSDGVSACIWNGTYHYASSTAVKAQQTTYSAVDYSLDVETAWFKPAGPMGFQRVWYMEVLGEYRSAHDLRIRIARDYSDSDASGPTWVDDKYWSPSSTTVGGRLQVRHGLASPQQCEAIKVRITDYADGSTTNPPAGEALRLTGLSFEIGLKRGLFRHLAAAAKQ